MNNTTKKILSVLFAIVLLVSAFPVMRASAATVANVGALWDGFTAGSGTFTVTSSSRVFVVGSSAPTGDLLQTAQLIQRELKAQFSDYALEMVWGDESWATTGDIVLKLDSSSGTGTDGYKLAVDAATATITAADTDGLIYGANSLIKCFRAVGGNSISGFSGNDSPDTAERTVSLDCGRKYYTAEWICNFIRQMSWMGYNTLQLHFSEDGGFRADFWDPTYYTSSYSPSNDFSWLCGSEVQYWVYNGNKTNTSYDYQTDPDADKYLSMKELIEICEVAAEYHIDIIPSFDSPAHMDYITWQYEQYAKSTGFSFTYGGTTYTANSSKNYCINYTNTTGKTAPTWYYAAIDVTSGSVGEAFALALYSDIADFFKAYAGSTDFSIGADEVGQGSSVKWGYAAFVTYINKLNGILNNKGYTMRMYNDFMGSTTYNYSSTTSTTCNYTFDSNIEIMYWDSPFSQNNNSSSGTSTVKASVLANQNRTLYNCIQSNCYYVLRVANADSVSSTYKYMDARNPDNLNWSFNYSTEQRIYETWTPNDFGEKGTYSTTDVVSDSNVGGAYFLIWNDYAALNTEAEVWNGVYDNTGTDSTEYYSLFDRMWSNTIKMWNWDVDDSVGYSAFESVRKTFGSFPGFTSCSADANLPAATAVPAQAYAADHSALTAALAAVKTDQGNYTDDSWNAYQEAITAAKAVDANRSATAEEIAAAITNLTNAETALVEKVIVDKTVLQAAVDNAITKQGSYTGESWAAYQSALTAAKTVLNDADATQDEVDAALSALNTAKAALAIESEGTTQIIGIRKLSQYATKGKKIGMVITTTADVETLNVYLNGTLVDLSLCLHNTQTLSGEEMGVWMINFPAGETGNYTYTITVNGTVSKTVEITVK